MDSTAGLSNTGLFPMAVFLEELRHDDVQQRISAVNKLNVVARTLGIEQTRKELIPFLTETLYDEDEILVSLAEQLSEFVPLVGGPPYAHILLPALENLAGIEETAVRNKACDSLLKVSQSMSPDDITSYFIPLVNRLSEGEWFTSRSSACSLFQGAYRTNSNEQKESLQEQFFALCSDDTPMVRRTAASKIAEFCKELDLLAVIGKICPVLITLMSDPVDSVRLLAVESAVQIIEMIPKDKLQESGVLDSLRVAFNDKSWRVRYIVSVKMCELQKVLGTEFSVSDLIPTYSKLLSDVEAEVRAVAASKIKSFCDSLPEEIRRTTLLETIIPQLNDISEDPDVHVRTAAATTIMSLSPILGKDDTLTHLMPFLDKMLKDKCSDVRLSVLSSLGSINEVIGPSALSESLLPAVLDLSSDSKWRVRLAVIDFVPLIANQLGLTYFNKTLKDACFTWLMDDVYKIREAAAENISKLVEQFGNDWTKDHVLPRVQEYIHNQNYLHRLTIISLLTKIAKVCDKSIIVALILPIFLKLSDDPVPNVKFNISKSLIQIFHVLDKEVILGKIVPCLKTMENDADVDVRYFASKSLQATNVM